MGTLGSKDNQYFLLKLCVVTPKTMLSNFSRVRAFCCFRYFGNNQLNRVDIASRLNFGNVEKLTWGLT